MDVRKVAVAVAGLAGLSFTVIGVAGHDAARAQESGPTITITNEGGSFKYSPDALDAKVGQPVTITNKDANGVHSVTAKDQSFSVDVPPSSSVTLTVKKAGNYPYYCQYHTDAHNPASLNVS